MMDISDAVIGCKIHYKNDTATITKICKSKVWISFDSSALERCVYPKSCTLMAPMVPPPITATTNNNSILRRSLNDRSSSNSSITSDHSEAPLLSIISDDESGSDDEVQDQVSEMTSLFSRTSASPTSRRSNRSYRDNDEDDEIRSTSLSRPRACSQSRRRAFNEEDDEDYEIVSVVSHRSRSNLRQLKLFEPARMKPSNLSPKSGQRTKKKSARSLKTRSLTRPNIASSLSIVSDSEADDDAIPSTQTETSESSQKTMTSVPPSNALVRQAEGTSMCHNSTSVVSSVSQTEQMTPMMGTAPMCLGTKEVPPPVPSIWDHPYFKMTSIKLSITNPSLVIGKSIVSSNKLKILDIHKTMAYQMFGDRSVGIEVDLPRCKGLGATDKTGANTNSDEIKSDDESSIPLPKQFHSDGRFFELLCTKVNKQKSSGGSSFTPPTRTLVAYYVAVLCPNMPTIKLAEELSKWGNFGVLPTNKAASRFELLFSPCLKGTRKGFDLMVFKSATPSLFAPGAIAGDLTCILDVGRDFEELPTENCHEGCGFIPRSMIEKLFGKFAVGKRTRSIQVRILLPKYGLFKGMLQEKLGITKIQLPPSCKKVGASIISDHHEAAILLVRGSFPSKRSRQIPDILNKVKLDGQGNVKVPTDFRKTPLSDMLIDLWTTLGIPEPVSAKYNRMQKKDPEKLEHSFLVGVADPTDGGIPEGYVYIPGLYDANNAGAHSGVVGRVPVKGLNSMPKLFVSRFPCVHPDDGVLLPILRHRPANMSAENWNFLEEHHFGSIIFGNSREGRAPLPTRISKGDLDGDLYFICWQHEIVKGMPDRPVVLPPSPSEEVANNHIDQASLVRSNDGWLSEVQDYMANISRHVEMEFIIKAIFAARTMVIKSNGDNRTHSDAIHCGVAFQKTLDLAKHGGTIPLPRHLWQHLPSNLHKYLHDVDNDAVVPNFRAMDEELSGAADGCNDESDDAAAELEAEEWDEDDDIYSTITNTR